MPGVPGTLYTPLEYEAGSLRIIFVNSDPKLPPVGMVRDGKTSLTAYSSIRDAFQDIPRMLKNQRVVIDCTGHKELIDSLQGEFALMLPTIIGEGQFYYHDEPVAGGPAHYATAPSWVEGELTIGADLADSTEPDIAVVANAEDRYDPVSSLHSLYVPGAAWQPNHYQGMLVELPVIGDPSVVVVPVISNSRDNIEFATDQTLDITRPVKFKIPSAELIFTESMNSGLMLSTCYCTVNLFGLKITVQHDPSRYYHDPMSPLSLQNTRWATIEACELDGIVAGAGNTNGIGVSASVVRSGSVLPNWGALLPYLTQKRRRVKLMSGTRSLDNCLVSDMILDQLGENGVGGMWVRVSGVVRCTELGHGQSIRQAHDNNYFDHGDGFFLVRKCHILDALASGVLYKGGTRCWIYETVIENSTLHGILCDGQGVMHVEGVRIAGTGLSTGAVAGAGLFSNNGSVIRVRSSQVTDPMNSPAFVGMSAVNGACILVEDADPNPLGAGTNAPGRIVVGVNVFDWPTLINTGALLDPTDGSRIRIPTP